MSRTLVISDTLYTRLEITAKERGLSSIEQLLEEISQDDLLQRQEAVQRIDALREQLFSKYGEMPDSTDLIREDRAR